MRHLLLILSLVFSAIASAETGRLQIEITGLDEAEGDLYVAIYNSPDTWLGEEAVTGKKVEIEAARSEGIVYTEFELPAGEYALSIYHDVNDNGDLDTNFIGIPKEPVALSNNARPKFGPPKYKDAVFTLGTDTVIQQISMEDL